MEADSRPSTGDGRVLFKELLNKWDRGGEMLDLKRIRMDFEQVKAALAKRGEDYP